MKKKTALSGAALAAGLLTAAMTLNVFGAQITEEKAKSIALDDAGQKTDNITLIQVKSDTENQRSIYEVNFLTQDYKKYEYEILVSDGTILSIEYETAIVPDSGTKISLDRAKELSLELSGLKPEDATFLKSEADYDDGKLIYETELQTADLKEYKYEFDGATGTVIGRGYDAWEYLSAKEKGVDSGKQQDAVSGPESARAAALKKAGLKSSDVTWTKLECDTEDGKVIYEGEFFCKGLEYEFEIDAATGTFLDWDVEADD